MKNYNPIVSIIIPVYNTEKYIAEAIESVLNQTFESWELLIINDGSTDDTAKILAIFEDERITILTQENKGVSVARNRGLALAKGEYITFLDADDALPSYALEKRVTYLERNIDVDIVHGKVSIRDRHLTDELRSYEPFAMDNVFKNTLHLDKNMFFNPNYMIRKKSLGRVEFQEGMTHAEDIVFLLRLSSQKMVFHSIALPMYYYRVSETSAMSNMQGWRQGYLDLLYHIKSIDSIYYRDTIIMRIKIAKMLVLWHIKNKYFLGLLDVFRVFK